VHFHFEFNFFVLTKNKFDWLTSEVGFHTITDTILEVMFNINATCADVVLKIVCAICAKEDDWSEEDK
jgi:hypothetical protein